MKKFLRFIGVLLLIIIAGVVIMGLVAPKDISVERSVMINSPKESVTGHMFHFKNFNTWNPFRDMDTTMTSEVTGEDGQPGAKYAWKGNKDMGSGEMMAKEVTADEMKYDMNFKEPMESKADGYWRVEDGGNGTSKAIWGFTTHIGFPWNGMMMIMGMKKNMEKEFDKGLGRLKTYVESHPNDASAANASVSEYQFPGHTYASIRKTVDMDETSMMKFFTESYESLGKSAGQRINGSASSLVYKWDEQNKKADLAPAFPVSGSEPVAGATMVTVAPSIAYKTTVTGPYSGLGKAHEAVGMHLGKNGKEPSLILEEYIKGPGEEKDSTKWVTNVIYLIK